MADDGDGDERVEMAVVFRKLIFCLLVKRGHKITILFPN